MKMLSRSLILWLTLGSSVAAGQDIPESALKGLIPEEAVAYKYFRKDTPHGVPMQVPKYSDLTADRFEELSLAGRPYILTDGGKGQPFVGWTCDRFGKEFPNGVVKVEYAKGIKAVWKMTDKWQQERHKIPGADPGGPQYAPWYWGVKGADEPGEKKTIYTGDKKTNPLKKVQAQMRLPPWMKISAEQKQEVFGSPEFWYSMPGAGATMHMDSHCESTYSMQLSGTRKWRLGWVSPVPNGTIYPDGTYADSAVYGKQYSPPLEATVSEGEALVIPAAFLHETVNVGDTSDANGGCAVSLTFQFKDPFPAGYVRSSMRHLRRTGDFNECYKQMAKVAGGKAQPDLAKLDKNGDKGWSRAEATTSALKATHAFYDVDEDGIVTGEELASGWSAWSDALKEATAKTNKKQKPKTFAYLVEGKSEL